MPDSDAVNPKLWECLEKYKKRFATMKEDLALFDRYFMGLTGNWDSRIRHVQDAWDKKIQVPDINTRTRSLDLQREIKSSISALLALAKSITRIADDPSNPDVAWVASHKENLTGLHAAIQYDKSREYQKFGAAVRTMK